MANQNEIKFEQPSPLLLLANQNLWMMLGGIVLLVLVFGYFFILQPKISGISTNNEDLTVINAKNQASQDLAKNVKALTQSFGTLEASRNEDLKKLQSIVPQGEQLAELFVLAEKLAQRRGFSLNSLDVSSSAENTIETKTAVGSEAKTESTSTVSKELESLSITMVVAQTEASPNSEPYLAFKSYLNDLESTVRLLDIESVSFSGSDSGLLSMSFTIKTYFAPIIK